MILFLVSHLVLTLLLGLYILMKISRLFVVQHHNFSKVLEQADRIEYRLSSHLVDIKREITFLQAKQGVNGAAFGLINAMTDFEETKKPRTDEAREKAAQNRRDFWAKKKEEQLAPPISSIQPSCLDSPHRTSGTSQSNEVPEPLQ